MYYELFRIKDGEVQPVNAREAQIKQVKEILKRDKGSPGDADGRKKLFAYKELGVVYWMADYRSPGRMNGYEGKDLLEDAKKNYDLPSTWEPDRMVTELIKLYEYNNDGGIAAELLTEISSTLQFMNVTTKNIREKLRIKLDKIDITEDELRGLIEMQRQIFALSTDIPKKIKEIKEAKELLKESEDKTEMGRGNKPILSSMKA